MRQNSQHDLILQFVTGRGPETRELVRAAVFRSDPVPLGASPEWEDTHRTFEIEVRLSGEARIELGEAVLTLVPGDVALIPAWEPHRVFADLSLGDILVIQFLPEFLGYRTIGGVLWLSLFAMPAASRPRVSPALRERVLAVAESIRYESEEMPFGWEDGLRAEVLKLLLILARSSPVDPRAAVGFTDRQRALERVMPAVTMAYADPRTRHTLEEAAAACQLGVRHFSSRFKRVMGVTYADFSLRVRLRRAAELLMLTDLPVEAVAERTGFTDHSHLSRSFVRAFGQTPSGYRRAATDD
jgi:AraC-like DNA-binding protein